MAPDLKLVKVGSAGDPENRMDVLNELGYAGSSSWELKWQWEDVPNAGEMEARVHKLLDKYRFESEYFKDGEWRSCREAYTCGCETAEAAIDQILERE